MRVVACDFETYYDDEVSIKPLGVDGYVTHPDAVPYLVSLYSEDADGKPDLDYSGSLEEAPWEKLNGALVVAHNARFDETIFLHHQGGMIPKACTPAAWACTADLAVYFSAPRALLGATKQLLGVLISKAYRGVAKGKGAKDFNADEWEQVVEAGRQDAYYCYHLWNHFNGAWRKDEQELSRINREAGRRGVAVDVPKLDAAIEHMQQLLWEAGNTIPWEWGGTRSKTPMLVKEIAIECRRVGIKCPSSFAQDSIEAQEWEAENGEKYPWIAALGVWRKGNGFLSKLLTIKRRLSEDGIFPFTLKYRGAHTGRLSGDGGLNMQNLSRDATFGIHIRHMFIPRPGCKFLILDYSQIEPRILAEAVGLESTLEMVRTGMSIYEAHAVNTMGYDPERGALKKVDPALYSLAKARVLALGYGCGAERFQVMAKTLCGLDLTSKECKETVWDFRNSNPEITQFWQKLHREMGSASRKESRKYQLELKAGYVLDFFQVSTADGIQAQVTRGGTHLHYYGGRLTENYCQAVGYMVLRDAILATEEQVPQYPMIWSVHDEIIFEVPEDAGEDIINEVSRLLTESSPWADGIPLAVEGGLEDHYLK